ncbi:MAG TPA: hypothetical protein VF649_05165 [Sphingomonas sp.]|jgi:hypothetical protein|uniref:hypothetical protein n=1 Tax=Sphingomonas sp. TaxID=28214 RepID=UPI002ED999CA
MATSLTARFNTRREAEMTVERLVQEQGIDRSDIFITADDADNSAGEALAGSDTEAGAPSPEDRGDAALNGRVAVSVDLQDDARVADVRAAFSEFHADSVSAR